MSTSDTTLWKRWQEQRDPDAFAEIVSRHSGMVYAVCRRILANPADAEEVAQDCFLALLNGRIEVRSSLAPWLHTVAVHRAFNRIKSETRRRRREFVAEQHRGETTEIVLDDLLEHIDAAIAALPEKLRGPVVCHFFEGQTYGQIARDANVAESTIRYQAGKAIERIRAYLRRRGITIGATALAGTLAANMAQAAPRALTRILGKLAVAGATAPIAAKSGVVTTTTLSAVGGLLMMKKLVVGVATATIVIVALVAAWTASRTADTKAGGVRRTKCVLPMEKLTIPVSKQGNRGMAVRPYVPEQRTGPIDSAVPREPAHDGLRIAGRVVDNAGLPVEGAHVVAQSKEFQQKETMSSADGLFEMYSDMLSNNLTLQAEKGARESKVFGPSKLREPGFDGIVLALSVEREGSIEGVVVNRAGTAIPGLLVNAHRASDVFVRQIEAVRTSPNGAFRLAGLAPGQYGLVGSFHGRNSEVIARVELRAGQSLKGVRAILDAGDLSIAGEVKDTAGAPIEGAVVSIHVGFGGDTSDENGHFEIKGLSAGTLMVDASHEKYSWVHIPQVAVGTQELNIVMQGKAGVEGRVLRADTGEPVTDFDVFNANQPGNTGPFVHRQHVSDSGGHFTVEDMEAGEMMVAVRAAGFSPCSQVLSLKESTMTSGLEFLLSPGKRVQGSVTTDKGTPVAAACIYAGTRSAWPEADAYIAQSDAAGRFEVTCLSPDTQQISVYHPDYAPSTADIGPASEVRIVLLQGGTIEGTVTRGGAPFPGIAVMALDHGERGAPSVTRTDGKGFYTLEGLSAGTLVVHANVAKMRDGGALTKNVAVEAGKTSRLDFAFGLKLSQVGGRITIAGEAPASAKLQVLPRGSIGGNSITAEALSDGSYEIEGVTGGEVMLSVEATASDGRTFVRGVPLQIAEGEAARQDVDFPAGTNLTGKVLRRRDDAIEPFIYLFTDDNRPPEGADAPTLAQLSVTAYSAAQCGEDGTFVVAGLPPGHYVVLALELPRTGGPEDGRYAIGDITMANDEPASIDLDLGE